MSKKVENWAREQIQRLIATAAGGQKQSDLASVCEVPRDEINRILNGTRRAPAWVLAQIAEHLQLDLVELLLLRDADEAIEKAGGAEAENDDSNGQQQTAWADIAEKLQAALRCHRCHYPHRTRRSPEDALSLRDWPHGFHVGAIIVGDRRESHPHTPADVLALPASTGDLMYLAGLGLQPGARIRSDKIVKIASDESLKQILACDVLVVGSSAANLATRVVNDGACFQFAVDSDLPETTRAFEDLLRDIRFDRRKLRQFVESDPVAAGSKGNQMDLKTMRHSWAGSGFWDPIENHGKRGTHRLSHNDFGVVSLCQHPWSEEHVVILAAGVGGPGTAAAIKMLGTRNAFADHPLGGIFQVDISTEAPWELRYDWLDPQWDTKGYASVGAYREHLEAERKASSGQPRLSDDGHARIAQLLDVLQARAKHPPMVACAAGDANILELNRGTTRL